MYSLTERVRMMLPDLLSDGYTVETPTSGTKSGIQVVFPDGRQLVCRRVPGENWQSQLEDSAGNVIETVRSIPNGLTATLTAQKIAEIAEGKQNG